ncbi:MAG: hypothetical protein B7Z06_06360, partial [Flavobacteriales bacterium 32-35-8]
IYNRRRIEEIWKEGNPFSWHLFSESKLIFSTNGKNLMKDLGKPKSYQNLKTDLNKFADLYQTSKQSLLNSTNSTDFELSMIFLAIRNFATCYSLGILNWLNFSRRSALHLGEDSIRISKSSFELLEQSRILSTRGLGKVVSQQELNEIITELYLIDNWFINLLNKSVVK